MPVSAKPAGYNTVTPAITVRGAAQAIEFYKTAFGAEEVMRFTLPDGTICHAEIKIGDSHVMLCDEMPDWGNRGPQTLGGATGSLMVFVDDVDARYARAVAAGATAYRPVENQFWGDRMGTVTDPFGHHWSLSTHVEDVSIEEMHQRFGTFMAQQTQAA